MHDVLHSASLSPIVLENAEILIRTAWASDRTQIVAVINQVAGERKHLQTDRYTPTPFWESLLQGESGAKSKSWLLVAERCGQIIGYARLGPETRPWPRDPAGNIGIALLAPYRHQGIGTNMIYLIIEQAARLNYQCLTADILANNQASLGLFKKLGFVYSCQRQIRLDFIPGAVQEITVERSID